MNPREYRKRQEQSGQGSSKSTSITTHSNSRPDQPTRPTTLPPKSNANRSGDESQQGQATNSEQAVAIPTNPREYRQREEQLGQGSSTTPTSPPPDQQQATAAPNDQANQGTTDAEKLRQLRRQLELMDRQELAHFETMLISSSQNQLPVHQRRLPTNVVGPFTPCGIPCPCVAFYSNDAETIAYNRIWNIWRGLNHYDDDSEYGQDGALVSRESTPDLVGDLGERWVSTSERIYERALNSDPANPNFANSGFTPRDQAPSRVRGPRSGRQSFGLRVARWGQPGPESPSNGERTNDGPGNDNNPGGWPWDGDPQSPVPPAPLGRIDFRATRSRNFRRDRGGNARRLNTHYGGRGYHPRNCPIITPRIPPLSEANISRPPNHDEEQPGPSQPRNRDPALDDW